MFAGCGIILTPELRLIKARRADAVEILGDRRPQRPHRKGLERREHPRARRIPDRAENGKIGADLRRLDDEGGGGDAAEVGMGDGSGVAGSGLQRVRTPATSQVAPTATAGLKS